VKVSVPLPAGMVCVVLVYANAAPAASANVNRTRHACEILFFMELFLSELHD